MYFLHYVGWLGCVKPCSTVDARKVLIQIHLKNDEAFQDDSSQSPKLYFSCCPDFGGLEILTKVSREIKVTIVPEITSVISRHFLWCDTFFVNQITWTKAMCPFFLSLQRNNVIARAMFLQEQIYVTLLLNVHIHSKYVVFAVMVFLHFYSATGL